MSFFEPPAPRPAAPAGWAAVPWLGLPDNAIGVPVAVRLVLARNEQAAVLLNGLVAFSTGVELELAIRRRTYPPEHDHWAHMPPEMQRSASGRLPDDLLRFGIEFSDGRKVTTLDPFAEPDSGTGAPPDRPVLIPQGGGGDGRRWDQRYWLWPLPPRGPIAFVCEWPALGIDLTRVEIDADLVLEAAGQSEVLWPDEPRPPGAIGWTSRTSTYSAEKEAT